MKSTGHKWGYPHLTETSLIPELAFWFKIVTRKPYLFGGNKPCFLVKIFPEINPLTGENPWVHDLKNDLDSDSDSDSDADQVCFLQHSSFGAFDVQLQWPQLS